MKHKLSELFERISRRFTVWRVNRALNIHLTDWQIAKIFDDTPFPEDVRLTRRIGKTTAQILFILLNKKFAGSYARLYVEDVVNTLKYRMLPDQFAASLAYMFGEDGITLRRRDFFVNELLKVRRTLCEHNVRVNSVEIHSKGRAYRFK